MMISWNSTFNGSIKRNKTGNHVSTLSAFTWTMEPFSQNHHITIYVIMFVVLFVALVSGSSATVSVICSDYGRGGGGGVGGFDSYILLTE